jgi:hypothetical protein
MFISLTDEYTWLTDTFKKFVPVVLFSPLSLSLHATQYLLFQKDLHALHSTFTARRQGCRPKSPTCP